MSQHDLNIANQGFPAFRSDLNNALVALGTNASGATEPSTTFAHQFWMDTAADPSILKVRNADNDAWITLGTFNQTADTFTPAGVTSDKIEEGNSKVEVVDTGTGYIVFEVDGAEVARFNPDQLVTKAGTASTPAISPTGDLNTGIFFPAADTIAFAEGGAEAMRINSSGNVGIGTSSPTDRIDITRNSAVNSLGGLTLTNSSTSGYGSALNWNLALNSVAGVNGRIYCEGASSTASFMAFQTTVGSTLAERMRITSSGNLLVGTTTAPQGNSNTLQAVSAANTEFAVAAVHPATNEDIRGVLSFAPNTDNDSGYLYVGRRQSGDRFHVRTSGNVANTNNSYGAISDIKTKQDVVDAGSQWDDIKNLRVRKFRFKNDPNGFLQIGVVAQEIEEVSPGLIDESPDYEEVEVTDEEGNVKTKSQATGTTTKAVKYSVLYMKAVKALQEAMERIETLEAKVQALENSA